MVYRGFENLKKVVEFLIWILMATC